MMIAITIDGQQREVAEGTTVLEAARDMGVRIPTLCHNDHLKPYGGCRLCLVEQAGRPGLSPSCTTEAVDGMEVLTDTERVLESRKFILELLLSRSPHSMKLQMLAKKHGVVPDQPDSLDIVGRYLLQRAPERTETDCILCGLCVRVCQEVPQRSALSIVNRGIERKVGPPFFKAADSCIGCGSCAYVCPTDAITIEEVPE